jgi:hypothetical protein
MIRRAVPCMFLIGIVAVVFGQEAWDIARTTINGKKVAIEYGRPILKGGRTLADLLKMLPQDRIWRAGAGPLTLLSTETDLMIGRKRVTAGNYSLYMFCPEKGDYALVVNSEIGLQPDEPLAKAASDRSNRAYPAFMDYTGSISAKEVARIPMKRASAPATQILIYDFEPSGKGVVLTIRWGDQAWSVEFQPAE